jgi:hypothetical protein
MFQKRKKKRAKSIALQRVEREIVRRRNSAAGRPHAATKRRLKLKQTTTKTGDQETKIGPKLEERAI